MKTFQLVIELNNHIFHLSIVLGGEFEWLVFLLSYKECSNAMQKMTSKNDWRERCRKMVKHQSLTPEGQFVLNLRIKAAIMYKFWTTQLKWEGFYVMGIGQLRGTFLGKTCLIYIVQDNKLRDTRFLCNFRLTLICCSFSCFHPVQGICCRKDCFS